MITFLVGLLILFAGYFTYSKYVEKQFEPDDRPTPAYAITAHQRRHQRRSRTGAQQRRHPRLDPIQLPQARDHPLFHLSGWTGTRTV